MPVETMTAIIGPIMFLELSLGQYFASGLASTASTSVDVLQIMVVVYSKGAVRKFSRSYHCYFHVGLQSHFVGNFDRRVGWWRKTEENMKILV